MVGRLCIAILKKCFRKGVFNPFFYEDVGKRCQDCYWLQRVLHEADLNDYLLKSNETKKSYADFVEWLVTYKGSMVATLKHNKFIYFFIRCDEIWQKIPSYESLVQEFKPNGLREHLTVLRWLIITEQINIDSTTKAQVAEQERIINLLAKFDDRIPCCINEYHEHLEKKLLEGRTSLKSVRLALQPAVGLCMKYEVKGLNTPTQEHIDGYLMVKHGQYSALYGFVTFLNKTYDLVLVCNKPNKDDLLKANRNEIEKQMINFVRENPVPSKANESEWLQLGMMYFHGVKISMKLVKNLQNHLTTKGGMVALNYEGKEYFLPSFESQSSLFCIRTSKEKERH